MTGLLLRTEKLSPMASMTLLITEATSKLARPMTLAPLPVTLFAIGGKPMGVWFIR